MKIYFIKIHNLMIENTFDINMYIKKKQKSNITLPSK